MSQTDLVIALFKFVLLVFSLSVHECAHAWMASRLGDQTARLQGRVTLNPMYHVDPMGTLLYPALMLFVFRSSVLFGWAKPTPVITRNFKKIVRDDNLTTLAGPVSNLVLTLVAFLVLAGIEIGVPGGRDLVFSNSGNFQGTALSSSLGAIVILAILAIELNLTLFFFNLFPIPPLDGSRIVRNMLPYNAMRAYDNVSGIASMLVMLLMGWFLLPLLMGPSLSVIFGILYSLPGR